MYFFPQDPMGSAITAKGTVHVVIAGALSLLSMASILTRAFAERAEPAWKRVSVYSFLSVAVVFVTGGLAAVGVARSWPVGGLLERLTIGAYLQWITVQAILAR